MPKPLPPPESMSGLVSNTRRSRTEEAARKLLAETYELRMSYALAITSKCLQVSIKTDKDLDRNIREKLDDTEEIMPVIGKLNQTYGPWAEGHSGGALRWTPSVFADFSGIRIVEDFARICFNHLVPVA